VALSGILLISFPLLSSKIAPTTNVLPSRLKAMDFPKISKTPLLLAFTKLVCFQLPVF